ncbi:MAG TPA: quaternary ammonium compound efflux SMR transporter SugE [Bacillota bacterium]|nr:quaternary ammonium compound efflux SMR transporter SugE [Bacillota bacterium]HPT88002.1 quaternary ammonium compound efflux SMR transporter SugE [Bacillota bacterium]
MYWLILIVAGMFEVVWAVGLKYSDGFQRFWPSVFTVAAMLLSVFLLSMALRQLPLGTAYAVWTGIGAVGTAVMGMLLFNEPYELARIFCIALIVSGIIGLRLIAD